MASTYIALAPECGDKLFGTNINYCELTKWGIYDGQENDPQVLKKYLQDKDKAEKSLFTLGMEAAQTNSPTTYSLSASNQSSSVWSLLQTFPNLSKFASIVRRSGWDSYLDSANDIYKVTVFAPSNQAFTSDGWQNIDLSNWNTNNLRTIAQAHTLPFGFEQESAYNRKLRLYTSLDAFSVYLDGTAEVSNKLNFYIPPDKMLNLRYPKPLKRINILQGYYTNNGALYVIDGVFEPEVIVY